jgi:hypothetical protein
MYIKTLPQLKKGFYIEYHYYDVFVKEHFTNEELAKERINYLIKNKIISKETFVKDFFYNTEYDKDGNCDFYECKFVQFNFSDDKVDIKKLNLIKSIKSKLSEDEIALFESLL